MADHVLIADAPMSTVVAGVPREPTDEPCPYLPVVDGACRAHILHPGEFSCDRCAKSKPPADIQLAPTRSAKIADWIGWAVTVGADANYAASRSRDELIDEFADRLAAPPTNPPSPPGDVTTTEGADA